MKLTLAEILQVPNLQTQFVGTRDILDQSITGISIDSRTVKTGELFFAIIGEKFDAHRFIDDVLKKTARAVVVTRTWFEKTRASGNFIIVEDTLEALQKVSHFYRSKYNFPVVAITGSNGKTTTKEMIAAVLSQKFAVLKNQGNLNNHIGVPLTLFGFDDSFDVAVIEMGANHFGEIKRLAEIAAPQWGMITNIGPAHLEFFGSLEGVVKEKTELYNYLESNNGVAFVNIDDPYLANSIPNTCKVITYGFEHEADIKGTYRDSDEWGNARFTVFGNEIKLQVAGMHNIYNALAAVAVGLEFNLDINQISRALKDFLPASKRMEIIREKGFTVINDCYNSNPLSAEKSLLTLTQVKTNGRRIAVLGDMLELGKTSEFHHQTIGEKAANLNIDMLVTFGLLSRHTAAQAKKRGLHAAIHFDKKDDLIAYLRGEIRQEDVILIKGSRGMAMEEVTKSILCEK